MASGVQFNVTLYQEALTGNIDLWKTINTVADRLQLYKILKAREAISVEELKELLKDNPLRHLFESEDTPEVQAARFSDYVGHWTLRSAYCKDYPSFFIEIEVRWFRMRFDAMPREKQAAFLQTFSLVEATEEELSDLDRSDEEVGGKWYKIPCFECLTIMKNRLCPLSKGFMYVPEDKLVYWLEDKLTSYLREILEHCKKMLPSLSDQLNTVITGFDLVKPTEYDSYGNLPLSQMQYQVQFFPLCMKVQYENLKKNHHLRHFSRVQFGLFMKTLGLSLEDALKMWKGEFTQKMTEEHFLKEYEYFFKHQYGTVGGKINYKAQNCKTILENTPGPIDCHGCPFKEWDSESLVTKLRKAGVTETSLAKIVSLKSSQHFQSACAVCFHSIYGVELDEYVSHPVVYYQLACRGGYLPDIEDIFESSSSD